MDGQLIRCNCCMVFIFFFFCFLKQAYYVVFLTFTHTHCYLIFVNWFSLHFIDFGLHKKKKVLETSSSSSKKKDKIFSFITNHVKKEKKRGIGPEHSFLHFHKKINVRQWSLHFLTILFFFQILNFVVVVVVSSNIQVENHFKVRDIAINYPITLIFWLFSFSFVCLFV